MSDGDLSQEEAELAPRAPELTPASRRQCPQSLPAPVRQGHRLSIPPRVLEEDLRSRTNGTGRIMRAAHRFSSAGTEPGCLYDSERYQHLRVCTQGGSLVPYYQRTGADSQTYIYLSRLSPRLSPTRARGEGYVHAGGCTKHHQRRGIRRLTPPRGWTSVS